MKLILTGDVSPEAAKAVIRFARSRGFTHHTQKPLLGNDPDFVDFPRWVAQDHLSDAVLYIDDEARIQVADVVRAAVGEDPKNLSNIDFADFIGYIREHGSWHLVRSVLRFAIRYELAFADFIPHETLVTPIQDTELSPRAINALARKGIDWLELLPYLTITELQDTRNLGAGTLREIVDFLASPSGGSMKLAE